MAELPSGLLEACVVVGASGDKLREIHQLQLLSKLKDLPQLEAEVLQVHAPPFVSKEASSNHLTGPAFSRIQRRKSFIKKKRRDRPAEATANGEPASRVEGASTTEDISVPKDLDLIALPQLCFPGGLQLAREQREDSYHYLVFTDLFGNRSHGVVVQYYRAVQSFQESGIQNGHRGNLSKSRLYTPFAVCVISKFPYYNALRDCLSCLLVHLRLGRQSEFEEKVKEFSAKLSLVPIPPPGPLHVLFSLRPLQVVLPSKEHQDRPVIDIDLHLPFLCFTCTTLLQVLSCVLQEQRLVFFSADWAKLTLVAESLLLYLQPLSWQQPYVPVLARGMLDFLMAPTAFLMGCHISHFEEVAAETEDLILVNIDDGNIQSSWSETIELPTIPLNAADSFISRAECLQLHYDLELCHLGVGTDANELRCQRRDWQRRLNTEIQNITLELVVNIFREVQDFLNYEHRVFNSEEFLRTREPADQPFYKKVLDTHIFHSFLRERLNRKPDAFSRMELNTRNNAQRMRGMTESPRRPPMSELSRSGYTSYTSPEDRLSRRLGASLPNLDQPASDSLPKISNRPASLRKITPDAGLKFPQKVVKVFRLPEFPPPLAYQYVQNYYSDMVISLGKAISASPSDDSALLARYHYLRGLVNTVSNRRLDALEDFQSLYKTDSDIFPSQMVKSLVDSLLESERIQADRRPELKHLISRVKRDQERERSRNGREQEEDAVKRFQLPKKHMQLEEFVKCVQESGIVKDQGTINRLFDALTVGHQRQVAPDLFRVFYTIWKDTETEAQEVCLPTSVLEHIEPSECVFKLSSSVKTSRGVGKIAMTQRRLFLLTDGRPGYVEVAQYRDIEEVKVSSAPFLLLRIPSLKLRVRGRKEAFEANLKTETELWNLMAKEMWAGRIMADQHKDPQYMQQALTNALLMDAVVGSLQSSKAIYAASKLAHFDRMKMEVPMMVPKTTAETLKHKINPSLELAAPQAVDVLLYTPGQLWVSLSGGKVMVFDASSWSLTHTCLQVGNARLNCMLGVDKDQVWMGSEDSVIYIICMMSMVCNRQLTEHRAEVTGLALGKDKYSHKVAYSCSAEGTVMVWDVATLQVKKQFRLSCGRLLSVSNYNGTLWCCSRDSIMEVWRNGSLKNRLSLLEQHKGSTTLFSSLLLLPEIEELWSVSVDSGEVCVWHLTDTSKPYQRVVLQDCTGCYCMIRVKNQVWVGGLGRSSGKGKIYILDMEGHLVLKELHGHSDRVTALCSAEDRYVLSGAAKHDGKIAIWKVE
ncbi:DENN domain-containing protein 3 [Lampris incognitus]|uniref:DENN domain-containing protein 3 n=1 Tax=Lampris incognitus TaxID=2546036 RepID=UPI0024B553D2|nr:DENN domain-containing protein 3 [Lampris incognitus]